MSTEEEMTEGGLKAWLESRPPVVRALFERYPVGTWFNIDGVDWWMFGATECGHIVLTPVDPYDDYDRAKAGREWFHPDDLIEGKRPGDDF